MSELLRQAAASRATLLSEARILRHRLDVPSRVKDSLGRHPGAWMVGTAGVGLLASILIRRRPVASRDRKPRGAASMVLGLAMTAARPLLKTWLTGQLGRWAAGFASARTISQLDHPSRNSL